MSKIIKIDDIRGNVYELDSWKPEQAPQAKKYFVEKYKEIENEYKNFLEDLEWNKIIYESEIMFVPVIGKKYFLYENKMGKRFLSLISPKDWKQNDELDFMGVFKQDSRQKWKKIEVTT
mgnify:CR=1 FL=1|tara:strand:- start:195 stop:551 length:357 start_codon:yes stop_codon:yes gene_type:complete